MIFYGYHGVEKHEKNWGARFEVDIELGCNISKALESDNLNDTVNYEKVYQTILNSVTGEKFFLIEALAYSICKKIKVEFPEVQQVRTVVRKPHAPIKGVLDNIEVEVTL